MLWFNKDSKHGLPSKVPPDKMFRAAEPCGAPLPSLSQSTHTAEPSSSCAISKYLRTMLLCLTFLTPHFHDCYKPLESLLNLQQPQTSPHAPRCHVSLPPNLFLPLLSSYSPAQTTKALRNCTENKPFKRSLKSYRNCTNPERIWNLSDLPRPSKPAATQKLHCFSSPWSCRELSCTFNLCREFLPLPQKPFFRSS